MKKQVQILTKTQLKKKRKKKFKFELKTNYKKCWIFVGKISKNEFLPGFLSTRRRR